MGKWDKFLLERERCKGIIKRKFSALIKWREENIKHKKRRNTYMLERLRDDILFLIDEPDYVRVKDRTNGAIENEGVKNE